MIAGEKHSAICGHNGDQCHFFSVVHDDVKDFERTFMEGGNLADDIRRQPSDRRLGNGTKWNSVEAKIR